MDDTHASFPSSVDGTADKESGPERSDELDDLRSIDPADAPPVADRIAADLSAELDGLSATTEAPDPVDPA